MSGRAPLVSPWASRTGQQHAPGFDESHHVVQATVGAHAPGGSWRPTTSGLCQAIALLCAGSVCLAVELQSGTRPFVLEQSASQRSADIGLLQSLAPETDIRGQWIWNLEELEFPAAGRVTDRDSTGGQSAYAKVSASFDGHRIEMSEGGR